MAWQALFEKGTACSFVVGMVLVGVVYGLRCWRSFSSSQGYVYMATLVFYCATIVSIVRSGAAHAHYMLQLAPLAA